MIKMNQHQKAIIPKTEFMLEEIEGGGTRYELDTIFEEFDWLFRSGKFDEANKMLEELVIPDASLNVIMFYLGACKVAENKLPGYSAFYQAAEAEIKARGKNEQGLFDGLEPRSKE